MFAPVRHVLPLTTIRRERLLAGAGRVVARKGQKLNAADVIAEAESSPDYLLLDVARGLGVAKNRADTYMQVKSGDEVVEGDLIAGPVGSFKRVVRTPRTGRVAAVGGGQVFLKLATTPFELRAGFPGIVVELVSERGAVIETTGALVQGVWGNGRIDCGLLSVLAKAPGEPLLPGNLDVGLRGSVVLAGHCAAREALAAAAELSLRGLILASLAAALIPTAQQVSFPVIVVEGFGELEMNPAAYQLLSTNEKREVALNAEPWDRFHGQRPEIIIPLPAPGELPTPREAAVFEADQQVRILRMPHAGKLGRLVEVSPAPTLLSNGLEARAGVVRLENGENVLLPLANLEVQE
ncbi:MAG: hypothetical protein PHD58_00630 [Anaerolineales bacterium]|nr:hypothetical protein [Anaerolineales bacterium]